MTSARELETHHDSIKENGEDWRKAKAQAKAKGFAEVDKFFNEDLSAKIEALHKEFAVLVKFANSDKGKRAEKDVEKALKAFDSKKEAVSKVALAYRVILEKVSAVTTVTLREAVQSGQLKSKVKIEAPAGDALPAAAQAAAKARLEMLRVLSGVLDELLVLLSRMKRDVNLYYKRT